MSLFHILYYIIVWFNINFISVLGGNINDETDFIANVNNKEESFIIQNKINIKRKNIDITSPHFILKGDSENAVIDISETTKFLFQETCESIEISNIKIIGDLWFTNNKFINFYNVTHYGKIVSNNNKSNLNPLFQISDSNFTLSETNSGHYFNNYNLNIENSLFYGNNIYNVYLIEFLGNNKNYNEFNIHNTLFSGNYHNSGIKNTYSNFSCSSTKFENMINGKLLNGYI